VTPEKIIEIAAIFWALLFAWGPVLKDKFELLSTQVKLLIQLGVFFVIIAGGFGLSCAGALTWFACGWDGAYAALLLLGQVLLYNQGTYQFTRLIAKARQQS